MNIAEEEMTCSAKNIVPASQDDTFHTADVVTMGAAHAAHDMYFSFLPTILPLLIQNLSLNTTQAGLLSAFSQIPNLLQPVIGNLADRKNLKILVVLAPTLSGAFLTLVGVAPSFGVVAFLMVLAGFSTAGFHSIAPALATARAGKQVGRGTGLFMVGGELGFGLGPLLVVASIGILTLKGLPWLMVLGMLASVILHFRLKNISTVRTTHTETTLTIREVLLQMRGLLIPIMAITFITGFLSANLVNYLPTFLTGEGASLAIAGISLTVIELAGTLGVFLMSMISDRVGQRNIALVGILASGLFSLGFLQVQGFLQVVMLIGIGLTSFIANPAYLSLIQSRYSNNRSLATGLYMSASFVLRSLVVVLVGVLADQFGMRTVFTASAMFSLLALPVLFFLPQR